MTKRSDILVAVVLAASASALHGCQHGPSQAETGGGGSGGGAAEPPPSFEPRVTDSDCTATPNVPASPLLVDTVINCQFGRPTPGVAAGAGDRGLVLFSDYVFRSLVTVESDGQISAIVGPSAAGETRLLSDRSGRPYLQAERLSGVGLGLYRLDAQGWWLEPINPALATTQLRAGRARFAGDGLVYLPYDIYDGKLTLATRGAAGGWTLTSIDAGQSYFSESAIDSRDRPHLLFVGDSTVSDWSPGDPSPRPLAVTLSDLRGSSAASTTDGLVAFAATTAGGIHIFYEQPGGAAIDLALPGTPYLTVTGCPPLPPTGFGTGGTSGGTSGGTRSSPCTDTGDGIVTQALARTNEALWLVYLWRHVDVDKLQRCFPFEYVTSCVEDIETDRSTAEIVVQRLPLDGMTPLPATTWRLPTTAQDYDNAFAVDSTGTRLLVVTAPPGAHALGAVRYVMFDESALLALP